MASYNGPTENIPSFNTLLFNQPEEILSQEEADLLYLSKTKTDTSTAPLTTFNGQLVANGVVDIGSIGNFVNNRWRMKFFDINSPFTNYTQLYMIGGNEFVIGPNTIGDKVSVYIKEPSVGTQIQRLEISHATTKVTNSLEVGTQGTGGSSTGDIVARAGIRLQDVATPYSFFCQLYPSGSTMNYIMNNNGAPAGTFHNFKAYNNTGLDRVALQVGYDQVNISDGLLLSTRQITSSNNTAAHTLFTNMVSPATLTIGGTTSTNTISGSTTFSQALTASSVNTNTINGNGNTGTKSLYTALTGTLNIGQATTTLINVKGVTTFDLDTTFTSRLNMNASSYSFPFASSQSIGYYLKATGTGTTVVSATPTTILTTASIPIGVWRIDFSVINVVGSAGAGTITQSQSFVSTTNNGAVATAVDFTGSVIRSHTAEVYGNNDVQEINGSFTYQQSTAGVLYLNIVRSFSTGTYSFTGELSITRIA